MIYTEIPKHSLPEIKLHLESLWKAILQEDFVFTFQNTFEINAFKNLQKIYIELAWDFKTEMNEWERSTELQLLHECDKQSLHDTYKRLVNSLTTLADEKYCKYKRLMKAYFLDPKNKIMLKWKPEFEPKLKFLANKLQHRAKDHCVQVYQSQKVRTDADNDKEKLNNLILGLIHKLVTGLGKMTEDQLIIMFEEKWNEWMEQLTLTFKSIDEPKVEEEVETCIFESFTSQGKFIRGKIADQECGKPLRQWGIKLGFKIKEAHIKVSGVWYTFWGNNATKCFHAAKHHTESTMRFVEDYLDTVSKSGRNFDSDLVMRLIALLRDRKKIDLKGFEFTVEYEIDMALTVCGYARPYFKEMAKAFKQKYDPIEYANNEMKPQFRKIFISTYEGVGNDKILADAVCDKLKKLIRIYVLESLPAVIVKIMRANCTWTEDKPSFIAKVLSEMGKMLEQNADESFDRCISFLTNARSSLPWWSKHLTVQFCHFHTPSFLYEIARQKLEDIKLVLVDGVVHATSFYKQKSLWVEEFCSFVIQKRRIDLSEIKHLTIIKSQELADPNFFTKEVVKGLNYLHGILDKEFLDLKYDESDLRPFCYLIPTDILQGI